MRLILAFAALLCLSAVASAQCASGSCQIQGRYQSLPPLCNCGSLANCTGAYCATDPVCPNGLCYAGATISYPVGLTVAGQYAMQEGTQSVRRGLFRRRR